MIVIELLMWGAVCLALGYGLSWLSDTIWFHWLTFCIWKSKRDRQKAHEKGLLARYDQIHEPLDGEALAPQAERES